MATLVSSGFVDAAVQRGSILVYRVFDVAEEIRLTECERYLRDRRGPDKFKVPKFIDRALVVKTPPLAFGFGERTISVNGKDTRVEVLAKIRDFGVISLVFQVPITPGTRWSELLEMAADIEEGSVFDDEANKILPEIVEQMKPAIVKPTNTDLFEDYVVYMIDEFVEALPISQVMSKVDVPALLLAEHEVSLSEGSRKLATENVFQYGDKDLTVVEWNSALVIDPAGGREIADILEFAVSELLEMRYYDDLLDSRLHDLYDRIEEEQKRRFVATGRYDKIYREASTRFIEFTEFIERVENSLKVVGDFYLATIYRAATRKFRLNDWQTSVTRKINILEQVSTLLQGEVNYQRSHLLELIVVLLILYEVLATFWH